MEALRALMSPDRKKARVKEFHIGDPTEDEDVLASLRKNLENEFENAKDSLPETKPEWALRQDQMLATMLDMIKCLESDSGSLRRDLDGLRLQSEVAQSVAEDAMEKVQDTDVQVEELKTDVSLKIDELQSKFNSLDKKMLLAVDIQNMINEALKNAEHIMTTASPATDHVRCAPVHQKLGTTEEKFSRTVVIGRFEKDTPKKDVTDFLLASVLPGVHGIEEAFAYTFGSIGFVRFRDQESKFQFLKNFNNSPKPLVKGKPIWMSTSKTPEERFKAKRLSKFKKMLIESNLVEAANVYVDYKRGVIFVGKVRIAEWQVAGDESKLVIEAANLKNAKIDAEPKMLYDALAELVKQ